MLIRPLLVLLAGLIGGLVVSCSVAGSESPVMVQTPSVESPSSTEPTAVPASASPSSRVASPSPSLSPSPTLSPTPAALAPAPPYEPVPGDVYPNAKRLAGAIAQQLTTYGPSDTPQTVAARVAEGDAALATVAAPLVEPGVESVGRVVYPQLGGATPSAASVMVVTEQRIRRPDGSEPVLTRVLDVRLRLEGGDWVFDQLASIGGQPVARPVDLDPLAAAVLDNPRITLPDSARWDILSGQVDAAVLQSLLDIAERHTYAVGVLSSGHPFNVFATERQSNHTRGRAADIYQVDGELVVLQRAEGSPAHQLASWLYESGVRELGTPWLLGAGSFTNAVHQDHLHIGFHPQ